MKKLKKSTIIPLALLIYLIAMAYIGRHHYLAGDYLFYFGIIAATLIIIIVLHFVLKKKEKLQQRNKDLENKDSNKKGNL